MLVPVSLLVPTNVLFENEPYLGTAGGRGISLYEYAAVLISITLVVFGTRIRRAALVAPGLLGLAVAVTRITELHFAEQLAWPLCTTMVGGLAMVAGAWLTFARNRKNKPTAT